MEGNTIVTAAATTAAVCSNALANDNSSTIEAAAPQKSTTSLLETKGNGSHDNSTMESSVPAVVEVAMPVESQTMNTSDPSNHTSLDTDSQTPLVTNPTNAANNHDKDVNASLSEVSHKSTKDTSLASPTMLKSANKHVIRISPSLPLTNSNKSLTSPQSPSSPMSLSHNSHGRDVAQHHQQQHEISKVKEHNNNKMKKWKYQSICISIPLHVTADLSAVVPKIRKKRQNQVEHAFPKVFSQLKQQKQQQEKELEQNKVDKSAVSNVNGENGAKENKATTSVASKKDKGEDLEDEDAKMAARSLSKANKAPKHLPKRETYASFVDYMEAKYSQGVMLDQYDDDEGGASSVLDNDHDEGQGSVYSQDSFFDDTDLRRTVAEQVLAQSTTTKLELQDQDNEFFVNVGNLEVEESEMTAENYDPLKDVDAPKRTRKRRLKSDDEDKNDGKKKKSEATTTKTTTTATATAAEKPTSNNIPQPMKSTTSPNKKPKNVESVEANADSPKKLIRPRQPKSKESSRMDELEKAAKEARVPVDELFLSLKAMVANASPEDLPRRKTKDKVTLTCLPDKKPGDALTFSNPHVPGQRLRVKIPPNTLPGSTFKVSVPIQEDIDPDVDYNKWKRSFYDELDHFANAYDAWCDASTALSIAQGVKDYNLHDMKREKYDMLLPIFPKNLKTPVDFAYLQKILRRARQNRHKRERSMIIEPSAAPTNVASPDRPVSSNKITVPSLKPATKVLVPQLRRKFSTVRFDKSKFINP